MHHDGTPDVQKEEECRRGQATRQKLVGREEHNERFDGVVDDGACRLLDVLVHAEPHVDVNGFAQDAVQPRDLERLGAERLHDPDALDRFLQPSDDVGDDRELIRREATNGSFDRAGDSDVEHGGAESRDDELGARADEKIPVEGDQHRCGQNRADERLDTGRRGARVTLKTRDQLAGSLAVEEPHREREEMPKQVGLHRRASSDANPQSEHVVTEVHPPLETQPENRVESIADGLGPHPLQNRGPQILQTQAAQRHPLLPGERGPQRKVQDRRHQHRKEGGEGRCQVARG